MKRSMSVTLAVALAVAAGAKTLRAAEGGGDAPRDRRAELAARMLERMNTRLGLSDEQAGKVKTIFEDSRKASEPVKQELKVSLEKLRWQVDAKAGDKELEATLSQIDKDRKALSEQREKMIERLNKELPAEARAKLALAKFEGMRRRRAFMRRGGPEMEPGGGRRMPPPPGGPDDDDGQ